MFDIMNLAFMPQQGGDGGGGGGLVSMLIMFGAVILVMYFLMIRPQQKRQKEHQKMLSEIRKGDKVITTSGIHGTVHEVTETTLVLHIADNILVTFEKSAVAARK